MTLGSILAVLSRIGVAAAPTLIWFALAWAAAGVAMAATLYPPAFTALTHWAGPARRVRALTAVTLVAGFASTIFAPLAAVLTHRTSWEAAYLVLTVPLAATIALHWFGLTDPWPEQTIPTGLHRPHSGHPRDPVLRSPAFWLLVASLTAAGLAIYAVVVNLVPLLSEKGIATTEAAVALRIGGAGQVAGRLLYTPVLTRLDPPGRTAAILIAAAATTAALAVAPGRLGSCAACPSPPGRAEASSHSSKPRRSPTGGVTNRTAPAARYSRPAPPPPPPRPHGEEPSWPPRPTATATPS